ncbi:MAG: cytochrome C oxidase subunit IV family protein [Flavobacteriales bacterium]|nr:cytochrome C oxidase subunit IV family protein [Flavobacteriales bacterium]MCB9336097.1 cytochrome C oxidase subunit IV family protein [Flavobacteriales bacterium]
MSHSDDNKPYEYAVHHSEEEGKKARKRIWLIFWVLLAITTVEVMLGIFWKEIGISWFLVKMTFIVLTIFKAFYIVAEYMHLKHEKTGLKNTIIVPFVLLALYLIYHVITEGQYSADFDRFFY